jgi:hypothetical protein
MTGCITAPATTALPKQPLPHDTLTSCAFRKPQFGKPGGRCALNSGALLFFNMHRIVLITSLALAAGACFVITFPSLPAAPLNAISYAQISSAATGKSPGSGIPEPTPGVIAGADILAAISRLKIDSDRRGFQPVLDMMAAQDGAAVEAILLRIPNAELSSYLLNRLVIRWAQQNPTRTAEWLLRLPSPIDRTQALISLGRVWADSNPTNAAAYALQFPSGKLRQQVLTATLSEWTQHDLASAAGWLVQNDPGPDADLTAAEIARSPNLIDRDVTSALDWAESITDDEQRRQSLGLVLQLCAERDRESAIQYVQNTPSLNSDQRKELMQVIGFDR